MRWLEVGVTVPQEYADAVANLFFELGSGVQWEEPAPSHVRLKGYFAAGTGGAARAAELRRRAQAVLGEEPEFVVREMPEEDWADAWRRFYRPFRVGQRLVVRPPWEECPALPGDLVLVIYPGTAFGCGTHPTTQMCLEALEKHVSSGMRVCDVGTGSGILAVAAALLGAGGVVAVDNDPVAVRLARENVARNGLGEVVEVREGHLLDGVAGPFDLVVANITAAVLVGLARPAARVLAPGGLFIAGGIIREKAAAVAAALEEAGFDLTDGKERDGWATLAGVKK
ncbi:MAG: 50S ribosomal protein L11 methyltransferase [Bacillota bacterium]